MQTAIATFETSPDVTALCSGVDAMLRHLPQGVAPLLLVDEEANAGVVSRILECKSWRRVFYLAARGGPGEIRKVGPLHASGHSPVVAVLVEGGEPLMLLVSEPGGAEQHALPGPDTGPQATWVDVVARAVQQRGGSRVIGVAARWNECTEPTYGRLLRVVTALQAAGFGEITLTSGFCFSAKEAERLLEVGLREAGYDLPVERSPANVELGKPVIEGPVDARLVRKVLHQHRRDLWECVAGGTAEVDAPVEATITLFFDSGGTSPKDVEVRVESDHAPGVDACLVEKSKALTFPASTAKGGGKATFHVSLFPHP